MPDIQGTATSNSLINNSFLTDDIQKLTRSTSFDSATIRHTLTRSSLSPTRSPKNTSMSVSPSSITPSPIPALSALISAGPLCGSSILPDSSAQADIAPISTNAKRIAALHLKLKSSILTKHVMNADEIKQLDLTITHIIDEVADVISFLPKKMNADGEAPSTILHYPNDLVTAVYTAASISHRAGYFPQNVPQVRSVEAGRAQTLTRHLNNSRSPFILKPNAIAYIPICYTTDKCLHGNALKSVLAFYAEKKITANVFLGRDGGLEENKIKRKVWLQENAAIVASYSKDGAKIIDRQDWVKKSTFIQAENFVASITQDLGFIYALEVDIQARLVQKKVLSSSPDTLGPKKRKTPGFFNISSPSREKETSIPELEEFHLLPKADPVVQHLVYVAFKTTGAARMTIVDLMVKYSNAVKANNLELLDSEVLTGTNASSNQAARPN